MYFSILQSTNGLTSDVNDDTESLSMAFDNFIDFDDNSCKFLFIFKFDLINWCGQMIKFGVLMVFIIINIYLSLSVSFNTKVN